MKLTYLYHSGFLLDTDKEYIVFDFFLDGEQENSTPCSKAGIFPNIPLCEPDYAVVQHLSHMGLSEARMVEGGGIVSQLFKEDVPEKPVYFLVSHSHRDHINYVLKKLPLRYHNVNVIFARDIFKKQSKAYLDAASYITGLSPGQNYFSTDGRVKITAFDSTDSGISFIVEVDNKRIFHAGDLNNWHYTGMSAEESRNMNVNFSKALRKIRDSYDRLDLVMFPCDPRLRRSAFNSALKLYECLPFRCLVAMHMWEQSEIVEDIAKVNYMLKNWPYMKDGDVLQDVLQNNDNSPKAIFIPKLSGEKIFF